MVWARGCEWTGGEESPAVMGRMCIFGVIPMSRYYIAFCVLSLVRDRDSCQNFFNINFWCDDDKKNFSHHETWTPQKVHFNSHNSAKNVATVRAIASLCSRDHPLSPTVPAINRSSCHSNYWWKTIPKIGWFQWVQLQVCAITVFTIC